MKVIAKKNRELALINAQNTQNENRAETIELTVPEEYEDYNKKIVFITDDGTVWDVITNNEYKITNAITKYDKVDFYIWLTKEVDGESIDFRTKTKTLSFYHNEDASDEITDEEIHGVNTVVNLLEEEIEKVENLNIEATKIGDTTTITITKKDGTTESVEINDGVDGQDAKINGKNSIEIEAGNNITIDNTETGIRINSTNDGGTTDYTDLENKPKINNVELSGNKSLNDLGIQPKGNYIEDNNYVHTDNNFNNTYKNKLEGLENYDDTEIKADISDIQDEQEEQNTDIENLQEENARLKATLPTTGEVTGQDITLDKTAEMEFIKPPLPMGNSEQESTTGRNLLPTPEVKSQTLNGVTVSRFEDGTITIKGTPTAQMDVKFNFEESTFSAGSYIHFRNNFSTYNFAVSFRKDGVNKIAPGLAPLNNIYQILEDITVNQMVVLCNNDAVGTAYDITLKPSIELTNEVTEYEKYTNGASPNPDYPQEITNVTGDVEVKVQNKNLFDKTIADVVEGYINSSGEVILGGTSSVTRGYVPISPNIDMVLSGMPFTVYAFYDKNKNFIERIVQGAESYTFNKNAYYIRFQGYTSTFDIDKVQLEKGSTSTPYTPHKEQTFTFPLGNEKLMLGDYLADDGIHHVRGQYNLNGDEYIVKYINSTYAFALYIPNNIPNIKHNSGIDNVFCTKLMHSTLNNLYYKVETAGNNLLSSQGSRTFAIMINNYTDINVLKEYLKEQYNNGTPVIVEYELEEEIIVPYTSAQQEVYNQIKQAISYEEQTNISGTSDGSNPIFNVEAYQDAKVILAEKGTYSKPSGGIPKTDLASDVQTSLGKADTALQEHQDISGKANKISVVQTSTSTIEINSNTFYKFGEVASLNITLASITDNTIYNEYMFEFVSGTTATTLTLPSSIKWLETPTIDANKIYQCSIVDNVGLLVGVANV